MINASGENAHLSSTASGNAVSHITIDHPSAQSPKEVLVLNADTQEELDSMKAFYSNKTYYSVNVESSLEIYASQVGFTDENGDEFDFSAVASQVQWTSSDPTVASVERSDSYPLTGVVTGNKAGTAKITLSYNSVSATFTVTVYPKDVVIGEVEKSIYLTTTQNVIVLSKDGDTKSVSVTAVGLASSEYSGITWTSTDSNIASVIGNGTSANIVAGIEGEAEIRVSHPDSENSLKIYVRVGSEYVEDEKSVVPYITAENILKVIIGNDDASLNGLPCELFRKRHERFFICNRIQLTRKNFQPVKERCRICKRNFFWLNKTHDFSHGDNCNERSACGCRKDSGRNRRNPHSDRFISRRKGMSFPSPQQGFRKK